jgi:hypothetical protein
MAREIFDAALGALVGLGPRATPLATLVREMAARTQDAARRAELEKIPAEWRDSDPFLSAGLRLAMEERRWKEASQLARTMAERRPKEPAIQLGRLVKRDGSWMRGPT